MSEKIDFSHVRFLIVDNNRLMGKLVKDILAMLGASQISLARDYEHALVALRSGSIDVCITEWNLKPRSGLELLDFIRNDATSADRLLPVIMLTANSEMEYVVESRDAGVTEFLAKPFTADGLYRRLVSVIARPRDFVSVRGYFGPDRRRQQLPFDGADRRVKD
ncbi:response regulator [Ferrovibrio sp.]|uniref:response regulator n=1 Tax=Ferrovibrio sp. TaxID=1917215 RepID=UPI001B5FBC7D|nr:response regulator [Ferrovibrio sp.]MBP7065270.1 response regulator [Ferrovibrio sp.]